MYAAYLYIFRAFDSADASRLAKSPRSGARDRRWPVAECSSRRLRFAFTARLAKADVDPREDRADW